MHLAGFEPAMSNKEADYESDAFDHPTIYPDYKWESRHQASKATFSKRRNPVPFSIAILGINLTSIPTLSPGKNISSQEPPSI